MEEDAIIQKLIRQASDAAERMFGDEDRAMSTFLNIPDARIILEAFRQLPDHVEGELTPYLKAKYLGQVAEELPKYDVPRLVREIRLYQLALLEKAEKESSADTARDAETPLTSGEVRESLNELDDYLDPAVSMEEFCIRHHRHLHFDPVERTPEWEDHIYEVESEVMRLCGKPGFLGYCFGYWKTKAEVLEKYGIAWKSPSAMNPGVMFD